MQDSYFMLQIKNVHDLRESGQTKKKKMPIHLYYKPPVKHMWKSSDKSGNRAVCPNGFIPGVCDCASAVGSLSFGQGLILV